MIEAGLTDEQSNLIPAQYGSVVYVSQWSGSPFVTRPQTGIAVGSTHHFPNEHYEKLQRLFLRKPICWSYEEEVRVVKCIKGISSPAATTPSGKFNIIQIDGRPMYLFALPPKAIREVYFGFRSQDEASDDLYYRAVKAQPGLAVYQCRLELNSMAVGYSTYVTLAEAVSD